MAMTDFTDDQIVAIDSLRERFAAQAHEAWAGWMRHFLNKCKRHPLGPYEDILFVPVGYIDALVRQMSTPYSDLSEEEKESDRAEADKYLNIWREYLEEMMSYWPPYEEAAKEVDP